MIVSLLIITERTLYHRDESFGDKQEKDCYCQIYEISQNNQRPNCRKIFSLKRITNIDYIHNDEEDHENQNVEKEHIQIPSNHSPVELTQIKKGKNAQYILKEGA